MPRTGFYNDNSARNYPIATDARPMMGAIELPTSTIVDFGCMIGVGSGYEYQSHGVWLESISRSVDILTFIFRCDAPHMLDRQLVFHRSMADVEFTTSRADSGAVAAASSSSSSSSMAAAICYREPPDWEGFLVTGDLTDLFDVLDDGDTLTGSKSATPVEPALVQNLDHTFVRSVNLVNKDRLRADGVTPSIWIVNETCMADSVRFTEGYNSAISVSYVDNAIVLSAGVLAGAGEPCDEVPLYEDEEPPDGSLLLTGGPACRELITTINGVGGPNVQMLGGIGVSIYAHPTIPHRVVIDLDRHDLRTCGVLVESSSSIS